MFSFQGRISRLSYFLQAFLALPLIFGTGAVALAYAFAPVFRGGDKTAFPFLIGLFIIAGAVVLWVSLALQTKRIRDMGWDPLVVLPGWFAFQLIDAIIVHFHPEYALQHHPQTAVSAVVNVFLCLALIFWPSAGDDAAPSRPVRENPKPDYQPEAAVSTPALSRASTGKVTFGRR